MDTGIIHGQDEEHGGGHQETGGPDCQAPSKMIPMTLVNIYLYYKDLIRVETGGFDYQAPSEMILMTLVNIYLYPLQRADQTIGGLHCQAPNKVIPMIVRFQAM